MTEKELRRLSREDLLEMLVNQSKEVERLKQERSILIEQLRYFKKEFNKVGSLDAILTRMGMPDKKNNTSMQLSALDELLLQFENEESTTDLFNFDFDEEIEEAAEVRKASPAKKASWNEDIKDRSKEAVGWARMQLNRKSKEKSS